MAQQVYHIVGDQGVGKTILAHKIAKGFQAEGLTVDVLEGDEIHKHALYSGGKKVTHYSNLNVDVVILAHQFVPKELVARPGERVINLSLVK